MSVYRPQKGDRVRVVLEGPATYIYRDKTGFDIGEQGESDCIVYGAKHLVSVEKLEPPVEVFKPGDVVRSKSGNTTFALGKHGYTYLEPPIHRGLHKTYADGAWATLGFTSERFVKVELVEKPF